MGLPGSSQTVQRLVDEYYGPLYRYAYRLAGSSADAEDLTQETFCKAQRNFSQLRDPTRARAWLFSILRNAYLHKVRSDKQHRQVSLDSVAEPPGAPGQSSFIALQCRRGLLAGRLPCRREAGQNTAADSQQRAIYEHMPVGPQVENDGSIHGVTQRGHQQMAGPTCQSES